MVPNLTRLVKEVTKKHIIVYPNSGEVYAPLTKCWGKGETAKVDANDQGLQAFADFTVQLREIGADIIGGCCRIYPTHIAKIRSTHDQIYARNKP